jgi:O-antigen ligase
MWVLIPAGGLLTGAAVIFYDKTAWLRTTFSTGSLIDRIELWQNTLTLLKGKVAVTGLGLGGWFRVYSSHYGGSVPIVHNSYLQLYCDAGILGLIAMILAAIILIHLSMNLLKSSWRNSVKWVGIGLIGSIIAGAIFAIFDVTISITYVTNTGYIYLVLPLFWIGVGLFVVVIKRLTGALE